MTLIRTLAQLAEIIRLPTMAAGCGAVMVGLAFPANAATCNVAGAANFTQPAREIASGSSLFCSLAMDLRQSAFRW